MILAVVLAALLLLFLFVRHNVGVPFLAMIAGVAVYEGWGESAVQQILQWFPSADYQLLQLGLYALLVAVFPLVLYLRAGKSGLFGAVRIAESIVFAVALTIMLAAPLASVFSFDTLAYQISGWLETIRGIAMIVGILFAYVDTLLFHSGKVW